MINASIVKSNNDKYNLIISKPKVLNKRGGFKGDVTMSLYLNRQDLTTLALSILASQPFHHKATGLYIENEGNYAGMLRHLMLGEDYITDVVFSVKESRYIANFISDKMIADDK